MSEIRCAWCRRGLDQPSTGENFCSAICQQRHEEWCRDVTVTRRAAVRRWRNETGWDEAMRPTELYRHSPPA
jgi:hypothetical protein